MRELVGARRGTQFISRGCYKSGETKEPVKNKLRVELHGSEIGNEDASLTIYETLEIGCEAFLLDVIGRLREYWTLMAQATRTAIF
jgi:hypothetical protein